MFSWRFYSGWALCLVLVMFRTAHDEAAERIDPTTPDSGTQRTDRYGDLLPKGAISRMGTSRFWADCYAVATVAFGSDSKKLLSLGQDRKIRCWDLATGEEVHTWDDSGEFIVSPDGKILVLRATEPNSNIARKVSMWDLATAKKLTEFESGSDRRLRALSPNGKTLFTLGALDQKIHLVRVPTAREFSHLGEESGAVSLAFSPDQRTLAAANKDNTITFWDVPTDKKIGQLPGHRVALLGVVFTADGQTLVSVGGDETVRLWDVDAGTEQRQFAIGEAWRAFLAPGGQTVAVVAKDNTLSLWDVATGKKLHQRRGPPPNPPGLGSISSVAFAPSGSTLAIAAGPRLDLWNLDTGEEHYVGHRQAVQTVAFSSDGRVVTSGSPDGIRLWETATGQQRCWIPPERMLIEDFAFSADGLDLALVEAGVVRICSSAAGKESRRFRVGDSSISDAGRGYRPTPCALSADARQLAMADGNGPIHLWDVITGREFRQVEIKNKEKIGHGWLAAVTFSPDGKLLGSLHVRRTSADARGDSYLTVALWEVATGKEIRQFNSGGPILFSPDGTLLATVGNGVEPDFYNRHRLDAKVRLWELATGKELCQLDATAPVAFSPDGRTLAAGGSSGTIQFWQVGLGKPYHQLQGPQGRITAIAFSLDGKLLVTGSADTTALVWNVADRPHKNRPPTTHFSSKELDDFWASLGNEDAAKAYQAVGAFMSAPEQAVALLKERLSAAAEPDPQRIPRLIADLDSNRFAVRQRAWEELKKLGQQAEPALQAVLKGLSSLEMRRRVELLLQEGKEWLPSPDALRALRAVVVLEHLNTPESRRVLETLARGAPDDLGTRDAQAAVARLRHRPAASP